MLLRWFFSPSQCRAWWAVSSLWLSLAHSGSLWLDLAHFCTLWLIPSYSGHLWVTLTRSLAHSRSLWLTLPHSFSFWLTMALSLSGLFGSMGYSVSLGPYRSLTLDPSGSVNNSLSPLGSFWLTSALYLALSSIPKYISTKRRTLRYASRREGSYSLVRVQVFCWPIYGLLRKQYISE